MRPGKKPLRIPDLDFKKIWEELGEEPPAKAAKSDGQKSSREKRTARGHRSSS
jgi:hypothetical protein